VIVAVTLCAGTSITVTVPVFSSVTNAVSPSVVKTTERGLAPVLIRAATLAVAVATATTSLFPSQVTYTSRPSGRTVTPSGSSPTSTRC
jgi:hypothetical protein